MGIELREKWRFVLQAIGFAVLVNSYSVYADYAAISENGTAFHLWFAVVLVFPAIACILTIPVSALLLFTKYRDKAYYVFALSLSFFVCFLFSIQIGHHIRMQGFGKLAAKSEPLVSAINSYCAKYGRPPKNLEEISPEFIKTIPQTGMAAYPKYELLTGYEARSYGGNPWALVVLSPVDSLNIDQFIYLPKQNYPEYAFGGRLENIGGWSYLHE